MRRAALVLAILASLTGNLSSSPNKRADSKKGNVQEQPPTTTTIVNNYKSREPESSSQKQSPEGDATPQWVLVIVGIVTAGFIGWQSWATSEAAKATARNTEAFIRSQSAIIVCDPHENPLNDLTAQVKFPRMRLELMNKGGTTAYHCRHESWIEFVPCNPDEGFDFVDEFTFSQAANHQVADDPISVYPNHAPIVINVPAGRQFTEAERLAIKGAQLIVFIRIRFTFGDAFNPNRFSDFGFWVAYDGLRFLGKYQDSN